MVPADLVAQEVAAVEVGLVGEVQDDNIYL